jgi:Rrf2 family iron-sulfur cluster assembly transcriptional regulator
MDLSDRIRDFLSDITLADLVARREIRDISDKQVLRNRAQDDLSQILVSSA